MQMKAKLILQHKTKEEEQKEQEGEEQEETAVPAGVLLHSWKTHHQGEQRVGGAHADKQLEKP